MNKQYKEIKLDHFNIHFINVGDIIKIEGFNNPDFCLPGGYTFPYLLTIKNIIDIKNGYVTDHNLFNWNLYSLLAEECYFLSEIKPEFKEVMLEFPFEIYKKNENWYIKN